MWPPRRTQTSPGATRTSLQLENDVVEKRAMTLELVQDAQIHFVRRHGGARKLQLLDAATHAVVPRRMALDGHTMSPHLQRYT